LPFRTLRRIPIKRLPFRTLRRIPIKRLPFRTLRRIPIKRLPFRTLRRIPIKRLPFRTLRRIPINRLPFRTLRRIPIKRLPFRTLRRIPIKRSAIKALRINSIREITITAAVARNPDPTCVILPPLVGRGTSPARLTLPLLLHGKTTTEDSLYSSHYRKFPAEEGFILHQAGQATPRRRSKGRSQPLWGPRRHKKILARHRRLPQSHHGSSGGLARVPAAFRPKTSIATFRTRSCSSSARVFRRKRSMPSRGGNGCNGWRRNPSNSSEQRCTGTRSRIGDPCPRLSPPSKETLE